MNLAGFFSGSTPRNALQQRAGSVCQDLHVGVSIGRKSFTNKQLLENLKSIFENLKKEKTSIFNAENIKNIYLSSTMGLSFKISFKEI